MKPELLLLHGAIGSKEQFSGLKRLEDMFKIYTMNFSGHGGEPLPEKFSMECFAEDILRFLEKHRIPSIHIFGYSMGGYAALYLASRNPERIKSIFTLATKFDWNEESATRESRMLNPEKITQKVPHFAAELEKRHTPQDWKLVLAKTAGMMLDLGRTPSLDRQKLEKINLPVLLCRGESDTMVSAEETQWVHEGIRNSKLVSLPEVQHSLEKVPENVLVGEMKNFFR